MEIRIAGLTADSIVDGPGLRLTVFTQGCIHACPGCHNPQSHALDGGSVMDTEAILAKLRGNPLQSGLTLSGGEPFLQPEACRALAEGAHRLSKNVWLYSGFTWEELWAEQDAACIALLAACDVLIDGRFELAQRTIELPFRGSRNQRMLDVRASLASGTAVPYEPKPYVLAEPPID